MKEMRQVQLHISFTNIPIFFKEELRLMKNLKKVLALVIAFTMMLGFGASASIFPDVADDASYAEAVAILASMKIMVGDDNGNFRPDDTITRAEATAIIIRAKGFEEASNGTKGATRFSDVASDHWATGYINLASQSGIIAGFPDGTFAPEAPVTYEQMTKMIVAALGYTPKAENNGGYPTGYLVIAAQEKINQGATGGSGEPAKRSTVARLIFNALTVKLMEQTGFGSNIGYDVVDKTLLANNLDIHIVEGIVRGTYLTTGNKVEDKYINFDFKLYDNSKDVSDIINETIYEDKIDVASYLGQYVSAYIAEDDDGDWAVIAIAPKTGRNKTLELDYSQIESFNETRGILEYTAEGSTRISQIELEAQSGAGDTDEQKVDRVKFFYNGRTTDSQKAKSFLTQNPVTSGTVKFVDNDNDDLYNYVFVTVYNDDYVVKEVGANRIIDKDDNTVPYIDNRDADRIVRYYKDGAAINYTDIEEGDVLTLAYDSSKQLINVYVANATVTGTVKEQRNSNGELAYTIDGKEYRIAANGPSVAIGDEGIFYLNVDNRIVYKETSVGEIGNYAYMFDAYRKTGLGGNVVEVQFINAKGEWITADVNKGVKVYRTDGTYKGVKATDAAAAGDYGLYTITVTGTGANTAYELEVHQGVFKYTTNSSGEINNIYLPSGVRSDRYNLSLDASSTDGTYKASDLRIGSTYFRKDTVVFSVPDNGVAEDTDDITVTTVGSIFQDDESYDYEAYDITDGYPNVVVVKGEDTSVDDATRALVITSVTAAKNSEDADISRIYGYQSGQSVNGITSEDVEIMDKDGSAIDYTLKAGDVVIFSLNSKGEINKIKVLMTYADATDLVKRGVSEDLEEVGFFDEDSSGKVTVTTMFGFAAKKESGNILNITKRFVSTADEIATYLIDESEGKPIMYRSNAPANFYEINTERSSANPIVITYSDLEVDTAYSTDRYDYTGSWVYVRQIDNVVVDVIVYTANNPIELED
jgi:hypothetical protein